MNKSRVMVTVSEDPYDHHVYMSEIDGDNWEYADKVVVITEDEWNAYVKARETYFELQDEIASRVGISHVELEERLK